ncbi:MAG: cell division protein ZapA [Methylococcaceae bacterium]|nr:cell division protein ZapA [Methylococcaceae bacterium]
MTKKTLPVSITIMGKEYKIACDADSQDDLIQSAQQLDIQMRKLRDSGKIVGPERIAVMTALNLAHELQILKSQNELLNQQLSECLSKMTHKIENVLENQQTR